MFNRNDNFISTVSCFERCEIILVMGQISIGQFTDKLYEFYGICHPDTISGMVFKRRAEFLAGRIVAKIALEHFGILDWQLSVGHDRAPIWPSGLSGSISHSNGRCCCLALAAGVPEAVCGVDIEKVPDDQTVEAILSRCLTRFEQEWIRDQTDFDTKSLIILIFSAKETIFKAYSSVVGEMFGFDCVEVKKRGSGTTLIFASTKTLGSTLPNGFEFEISYNLFSDFVITHHVAMRP
ncbi:MAG: 4'-phosphopantetheinyl transferase superfamily protein [Rhizobiales bacterium]|nr:4'-phosphopantetheinyl transferase superfamily protein [Hyphomicrobiales bacterium]